MPEDDCGTDQRICANGDCVCGAACTVGAQCAAGELCASRAFDPVGVCVEQSWCNANGCIAADDPCVSCTSAQTCVQYEDGSKSCADFCSDASDCASACCRGLSTGASACVASSFCEGGGGGGEECNLRSSCISAGATFPTGPGNCAGEVVGSFTNNCSETIECQICPVDAGSNKIGACHSATFSAGQTQAGELSGHWWCGISGQFEAFAIQCALPTDPSECILF